MRGAATVKVALTGDVALNLIAPYFREAGYEVYVPDGFGTWKQELVDNDSKLHAFAPDFVFDVTAFDDKLAAEVSGFWDERMRKLVSQPYSLDGIMAIVREFEYWRRRRECKVLAVDADNTLWKGILSEDGVNGLEPCAEFQHGLKALNAQGAVLVLLSKNDPEPIHAAMEELRRKFGDELLSASDFAVLKANWGPKAGNLVEACRELNVGLDSVAFVDDNAYERAQMKAHLPEVAIVPWTGWDEEPRLERQLIRRLKQYFFAGTGETEEDALRNADYASRAKQTEYASLEEYLEDLQLEVTPGTASEEDLDRLAQMAGKTNQFNATTIRRSREEFAELLADAGTRIFTFRTKDRFAEQGLVCYIIVRDGTISDFVMSCRVMGRTLEHFVYAYVCERLGFAPKINFESTAKNRPFAEYLQQVGLANRTYYKESEWQRK